MTLGQNLANASEEPDRQSEACAICRRVPDLLPCGGAVRKQSVHREEKCPRRDPGASRIVHTYTRPTDLLSERRHTLSSILSSTESDRELLEGKGFLERQRRVDALHAVHELTAARSPQLRGKCLFPRPLPRPETNPQQLDASLSRAALLRADRE
jgi:hypothetical protein